MIVDLQIPSFPVALSMIVHGSEDEVSRILIEEGIWEPYETDLVTRLLKPGQVFIDVGANAGYYSLIASHLVGESGQVVAFEPEQTNFALLSENLKRLELTNYIAIQSALHRQDGEGVLYLSDSNLGDHRLSESASRDQQTIRLMKGDLALKELQQIDFIKVDTQGAETYVVEGLLETIKNNARQLTMILEFWPFGLQEAGSSARELLALIEPIPLDIFVIDHEAFRLLPTHCDELLEFAEKTHLVPERQGFVNLLLRGRDCTAI
ncbi:MAG TPA: FkbM family methyltransferase [Pseudomonadales bacterium]|nr:FkbM family methyltransferase [Pseudomonadales bacterium]HJP52188.1 FkbM family methyltransferase [Pseudomonadales bacterium]